MSSDFSGVFFFALNHVEKCRKNVDGQKSKMLVVDEEEAKLIRLIYEKYLQGMGVNAVTKWLNENGYTKTVRQNGTVPNISAHFVTNVLDNPVYCGKISYGRRRTEKIDGTRNEFHTVGFLIESVMLFFGNQHFLAGATNIDKIGLLVVFILHNESPPSAFAEMESSRHAKPDHRCEGIPEDYSASAAPHLR